jgi:diguanylate cyclase (GGDEF)-like protein
MPDRENLEKLIEEYKKKRRGVDDGAKIIMEEFALVPEELFLENERLKKEVRNLRELVFTDELTNVLNRRGFITKYEPLFNVALYNKNNPKHLRKFRLNDFSILFFDLDDFKPINDTYGHDVGDQVLVAFAQLVNGLIREVDSVARIGGEEFLVSLLGATEEDAYFVAEKIRQKIMDIKIKGTDRSLTASIGVASIDKSDADIFDELIGYADKAMYAAKASGKNRTVKYSEIK